MNEKDPIRPAGPSPWAIVIPILIGFMIGQSGPKESYAPGSFEMVSKCLSVVRDIQVWDPASGEPKTVKAVMLLNMDDDDRPIDHAFLMELIGVDADGYQYACGYRVDERGVVIDRLGPEACDHSFKWLSEGRYQIIGLKDRDIMQTTTPNTCGNL